MGRQAVAIAVTTLTRSLATGLIGAMAFFAADALIATAIRSGQPQLASLTLSGSLGDLSDPGAATVPVIALGIASGWPVVAIAVSMWALDRRDTLE